MCFLLDYRINAAGTLMTSVPVSIAICSTGDRRDDRRWRRLLLRVHWTGGADERRVPELPRRTRASMAPSCLLLDSRSCVLNGLPVSVSFVQGWGKTIILGVEMHGAPLCISPHEILHGKSVIGSMFGGVKPKQDIPILADKYMNKVQPQT